MKWQQIQGEIAQEYDVIKNIMQTLNLFKGGHHDSQAVGARAHASFEEPTRDPDVWPAPPPRDAAPWEPPTHASDRGAVKPIRGPGHKKSETGKIVFAQNQV